MNGMNYKDLQELQATKRDLRDREINSGLNIPIAQNMFVGLMITIAISVTAWVISSIAGIPFIENTGIGTTQDYIKFGLMALVCVTVTFLTTLGNALTIRKKGGYGNVVLSAIVLFGLVVGAVSTSFTAHAIFWMLIAIVAGIFWTTILLILRFSSEESVIARTIYSLGRASLSGKIAGLEQTNQRLLRTVQELDGKADTFYTQDKYNKRKRMLNDALAIYDYTVNDSKGAPSKRTALAELNIPQDRWSSARDALRAVEVLDALGMVLNRDRGDVENKLAVWLQKHIN